MGFISLPDEVVKAANQADAQPYQLKTMLDSADANRKARVALLPTEEERDDPNFADRQAYAAASDPDSRVEVIHISGGGGADITGVRTAAAILASRFDKGEKKK